MIDERNKMQGKDYTILLFDADGTILDFNAAEGNAFLRAMGECGLDDETARDALPHYRAINDALWYENEKGNITKAELKKLRWARLGETCHIDAAILEKASPLYSRYLGEQGDLLPDADALLRALQAAGKRLFLITNGLSSSQYGRIRAAGIEDCFEKVFVSEDLGYSKPDRRFFETAASQIPGFSKAQTLVIGDRLYSDIACAAAFGVPSVCIAPER